MARTATAQKQPQKTNNEKRLIMLFVRQISIFAVSLAIVIAAYCLLLMCYTENYCAP